MMDKTKELLKKAFYRGNEVADIPTDDFEELAEDWEKWYSDNVKNILPLHGVSCMFAYHPENEEVGRVFRNTMTNKWYYDEGLAEIIGWRNVEKLKET